MAKIKTPTVERIKTYFDQEYVRKSFFEFWHLHLNWMSDLGFAKALEVRPRAEIPSLDVDFGHKTVDLLRDFIRETGYVNAHFGLTSSDVEDNVRLRQIREAANVIKGALYIVQQQLVNSLGRPGETLGFTHWQPASPISWANRVAAWNAPLTLLEMNPPEVFAKELGGPVGNRWALERILGADTLRSHPFYWDRFSLKEPQNVYPIQSTDYLCEFAVVSWLGAIASQLHKIATDLRFLLSRGTIKINHGPIAGSSSMPHKSNPYKWEKVCGLTRAVSMTLLEIWNVRAHNGLERTLDGSWGTRDLLQRAFFNLAQAIDEFNSVHVEVDGRQSFIEIYEKSSNSERDLVERVLTNEDNRWSLYTKLLEA